MNKKLMKQINNGKIQEWMNKIKSIQIGPSYLAVATGIALFILLVPILKLANYSHPSADDFGYGGYPHLFWETTHSLSQTFHWAFYQVRASYDTWQGTFSSIFLMALSPAVFNEDIYWITTYIMLSMLIGSNMFIWKVFLRDLLKADRISWWVVSIMSILIMIEQMHWPAQGIYWYNASVHYTFMHSCMLFLTGCSICILTSRSKLKIALLIILSCLLAIACGGSNYVTSLTTCVILTLVLIAGLLKAKKKALLLLIPMVINFICFYFNLTAPGNAIRQINYISQHPLVSIYHSFVETIRKGCEWYTLLLFLCMVFIIPVVWNMVRKAEFSFSFPGIVTIMSLCLIAVMYTPNFYVLGAQVLPRVTNIIKLTYHILLFANEIYWLGWLSKALEKNGINSVIRHRLIFYVTMGILFFVSFQVTNNRERDFISYAAYASLASGQAKIYHQEYIQRRELLDSEEQNVVLNEFTQKPFLLFIDDITTDPTDWRNQQIKNWYMKESVVLSENASAE